MPTELLFNQCKVVSFFGGASTLGLCPPRVNMVTERGTILSIDSGNFTCILSRGTDSGRFYTNELLVASSIAISSVAWPTGVGCTLMGHSPTSFIGSNPTSSGQIQYVKADGSIGLTDPQG